MPIKGFWHWLFKRDEDGDRGIANVINWWLLVHLSVGAFVAICTGISGPDLASKIALPGSAVLVGLAFGWAGRSAGLFQDKSFSKFIIEHGAPIEGYVYSFQLAILMVVVFVSVCLLVGFGGIGLSTGSKYIDLILNKFYIVTLGSVATRECWGVMLFVNKLTIQYYRVRTEEIARETEK